MRHLKLFQRFLNENNSTSIIDEIIQLDDELENNPVYKQYEREFLMEMFEPQIDKQIMMIARAMGVDSDDAPVDRDDLRRQILDLYYAAAKEEAGNIKKDEQTFREKRGNIMPMIDRMIKLAEKDQEFRLCAKLKRYNDLLAQI